VRLDASAKDLLIGELTRLRLEVGMPSLAEIARLSGGKFSKSTLDDHLSGRRAAIPNMRFTLAYVEACLRVARNTGIGVDRFGTMTEWEIRWKAAQAGAAAVSPIREPAHFMTRVLDDGPAAPPERLGDAGHQPADPRRRDGDATTADITTVMRLLEADVLRLRDSLPADEGLLVIVSGPLAGTRFSLTHELTTIGRDPDSDVFLDEPTISRRHAVIHRYGTEFTIRDLGSRNQTLVHQRRIAEETTLLPFEQIQVGVFRMLFVQGKLTTRQD
jgi:hypothetical protein